jgi:uncharacterized membrane protein
MVAMGHAQSLLGPLAEVVVRNRFWMLWNLILAAIPLLLAVPLFRHPGRRGPGWWLGLGVVVLFLPNAPYVVTDLLHLRSDVVRAGSDGAVVGGVLPAYAAFVAAGFLLYTLVLREAGRFLQAQGLGRWRPGMEVALHLVCAVGVVLGRVARLNSWEPVTDPDTTAGRVVDTLTWSRAPLAVAVLFVVIWAGHAVVRGAGRAVEVRLVAALDTWLRPGTA